jgi:hypothetical protein
VPLFQEHPAPRHSCNALHFYFLSSSVVSNLCAKKFLEKNNNFKKFKFHICFASIFWSDVDLNST